MQMLTMKGASKKHRGVAQVQHLRRVEGEGDQGEDVKKNK